MADQTRTPGVGQAAVAQLSGGQAVAETLLRLGVTKVFSIASVHNLPIYKAITESDGIEVVACRHEQFAVHAADGYARATGKPAAICPLPGPGLTNAMLFW